MTSALPFRIPENDRGLTPILVDGMRPPDPRELFTSYHKDLHRNGILLFRGLEMGDQELGKFAKNFSGREPFDYAGGVSPRLRMADGVYSSTEYPPELRLSLHNEMSYAAAYPRYLFFYCSVAPSQGGETTYGDSRRILGRISSQLAEDLKVRGIRYDRHLYDERGTGYSWQDAFETDDRAQVEDMCSTAGASCHWSRDGSVRISEVRRPTAVHPETGEEVWFNQADGFHADEYNCSDMTSPRLDCHYGDGAPLGPEVLDEIRAAVRAETIPHKWKKGDLLVLDNLLAAHGRAPFAGDRRILLAMT